MTYEDAMAEAFPAVDAGIQPFGSRVLIQIRTPKKKSAGGIIIDIHGSNETEKWNTQIGKAIYSALARFEPLCPNGLACLLP